MLHDRRISSLGRRAFSLTEILVVIAIIAVLASLAAVGTIAVIGNRKGRDTEATIRVVNKVLQSHWSYVIDEAKKDTISPAVLTLASSDMGRARVLWIKLRLMEAFPQSFAEIGTTAAPPFFYTGANPYIPTSQRRYIAGYQSTIASRIAANTQGTGVPWGEPALTLHGTESSACLLMALSVSRGGNALTEDMIKYAVADTDNDGVKELIDAWGKPLAFFRSPYKSAAVNPAAAGSRAVKFADPVDPDGTLVNATWYALPARTTYETNFALKIKDAAGNANFVIPFIVSAGKDGKMSLNIDGSSSGAGSNDNIFSYNLRLD